MMTKKVKVGFRVVVTGLGLGLTACGTTGPVVGGISTAPAQGPAPATLGVEAALPLVRTGAAVATGAVLDFAVKQSGTRTRLANEMYAAANAVYSLSGGTFPAPAQFDSSIRAFGGSQADASYAQFSTAIAGLYAAYYPQLATGDAKSAADLLNAIAGGIEDATQAYVTAPVAAGSVTGLDGIGGPELTGFFWAAGSDGVARSPADGSGNAFPEGLWKRGEEGKGGNGVAQTIAFPNGVWERGELLSF